jgi:hypothetical protein
MPRGTLRSNRQSPGNSSRLSHQDASVPARELAREARLPGRFGTPCRSPLQQRRRRAWLRNAPRLYG